MLILTDTVLLLTIPEEKFTLKVYSMNISLWPVHRAPTAVDELSTSL